MRFSLPFLLFLMWQPVDGRAESGSFHVGVYGGQAAKERMLDILTRYNTGFIDSYLVAVAPGYVHGRGKHIRREIEGQVVYHWGEQSHWEFNAAYMLRWMTFPWDHRVDTRFALGAGVSWATEVPFIEPRAKELGEEESAQFLGYVAVEIELAPPGDSPWSGFIRLHHRSDAFGLFHDKRGGSNFITVGTRYYF
ncbi:MAG: hypothetical protein EA370_17100 [Wenzhouxiangella sp.]|nr:MAG: hypothetical protein EA370_17100 [Wenzhouxiangella sp.]